jgi:hypothetical protein
MVAVGGEAAILLLCLTISGLSLFIQESFKSQMILRQWYLLLILIHIKNWRRKDRWKRKLLMPLGLCVYCMSFWLSLIIFVYTNINVIYYGIVFLVIYYFNEKNKK